MAVGKVSVLVCHLYLTSASGARTTGYESIVELDETNARVLLP